MRVDAVVFDVGETILDPSRTYGRRLRCRVGGMAAAQTVARVLRAGHRRGRGSGAVCDLVGSVRVKFAGAQIVLLGNAPVGRTVVPKQVEVERALVNAARTCHVALIDPIAEQWTTSPALVGSVPGHPNDAGYAYIAKRVVSDLERFSSHQIVPS